MLIAFFQAVPLMPASTMMLPPPQKTANPSTGLRQARLPPPTQQYSGWHSRAVQPTREPRAQGDQKRVAGTFKAKPKVCRITSSHPHSPQTDQPFCHREGHQQSTPWALRWAGLTHVAQEHVKGRNQPSKKTDAWSLLQRQAAAPAGVAKPDTNMLA